MTVQERVKAGIDYLNTNHPGWLSLIDLDRLNLANGCNCIGGQIFSHYQDFFLLMAEKLRYHPHEWMCRHGFNNLDMHSYEELEQEWVKQILELRSE